MHLINIYFNVSNKRKTKIKEKNFKTSKIDRYDIFKGKIKCM